MNSSHNNNGHQGMATVSSSSQQKKYIQSSLSSSLHLIHHPSHSSSHQLSLLSYKNKNVLAHQTAFTFVTFNAFSKGQQMLGDLLRLMSDLKIHIIALQDSGELFQTKEGKSMYGNYHIEYFRFGEGKNDTLAFIIDEGIMYHLIKEIKFITNQAARTMTLIVPRVLNGEDLYLINTYAPATHNNKPQYIQNLQKFLQKHKLTSNNSVILGDLNDFVDSDLDYWTNKQKFTQRKTGLILNPLRRLKFYDAFRVTYPDQIAFSRIGDYDYEGALSTKQITMTRIDYILMSFALIQQLDCITILDGYKVGSDHRPIMASLAINIDIPHIASLTKHTDHPLSKQDPQLPPQPYRKYIKDPTDEESWKEYKETVQCRFLASEILINTPQTPNELDTWSKELVDIIDRSVHETFHWDEPGKNNNNNNEKNDPTQQNTCNNNSQQQDKQSQQAEYTIPNNSLETPLPKVLYKNKLKSDIFKSLNILKSTLNTITSLLIICVKNKIPKYPTEQFQKLQMLWRRLQTNSHMTEQLFQKYDTSKFSATPLQKQQDESETDYRHKEVE